MHTVEIPEAEITFSIPSSFEEMNQGQYLYVIKRYLDLVAGKINIIDFYNHIIAEFIGLYKMSSFSDKNLAKKYGELAVESYYSNLVRLHPLLYYILQVDENGSVTINYTSVKNLIPEYYHLVGPADALQDSSFGEWIYLQDLYRQWKESPSEKYLNAIVGAMYREPLPDYEIARFNPSWDGSKRIAFNCNLSEVYSKRVEYWQYHVKYAILLYYINCVNYICSGDINLHGRLISFKKLFTKNDNPSSLGSTGIVFKIAETGIFGNVADTLKENVYNVYLKLLQWKEEYDEFKLKNNT